MALPLKKLKQQEVVRRRISVLFGEAEKRHGYANAYAKRIAQLSTKYRVRLPRDIRIRICKRCFSFLFFGVNARIRTNRGKVSITCNNCGLVSRVPLAREKSLKRTSGVKGR